MLPVNRVSVLLAESKTPAHKLTLDRVSGVLAAMRRFVPDLVRIRPGPDSPTSPDVPSLARFAEVPSTVSRLPPRRACPKSGYLHGDPLWARSAHRGPQNRLADPDGSRTTAIPRRSADEHVGDRMADWRDGIPHVVGRGTASELPERATSGSHRPAPVAGRMHGKAPFPSSTKCPRVTSKPRTRRASAGAEDDIVHETAS